MVDRLSSERRSWLMSRVQSKNTSAETRVRSVAHAMGLRFRLHSDSLPGKPDIVFPKWKTVVFIHGCFWHRHPNCKKATIPKSNTSFWTTKFERNVARDQANLNALEQLGWKAHVIWECETKSPDRITERLKQIFPSSTGEFG
jgi:DNA mismatch endonuclease, patch repair protein